MFDDVVFDVPGPIHTLPETHHHTNPNVTCFRTNATGLDPNLLKPIDDLGAVRVPG